MFRITNEWLIENRTKGGGYTKNQLNILGIEWPPRVGWKNALIDKEIGITKAKEFETIANKTKENEKQATILTMFNKIKSWEDDEILKLLKLIQKNVTIDVIAEKLKRTKSEILNEIRQIAKDYWFNDKRPIEEIQKYTRLSKEEIDEIICTSNVKN